VSRKRSPAPECPDLFADAKAVPQPEVATASTTRYTSPEFTLAACARELWLARQLRGKGVVAWAGATRWSERVELCRAAIQYHGLAAVQCEQEFEAEGRVSFAVAFELVYATPWRQVAV
jgi:hypothetical protein